MGNGNKVGFMPNKPILFTIPQQYREKNMPWLGWGPFQCRFQRKPARARICYPFRRPVECPLSVVCRVRHLLARNVQQINTDDPTDNNEIGGGNKTANQLARSQKLASQR